MSIIVKILYPNKEDLVAFEISGERITFGRHPECEICLRDDMMSNHHLRITGLKKRVYIEDLGSSNGSTINAMTLSKRRPFHLDEEVEFGEGYLIALDRMNMTEPELVANRKPHQGAQPLTIYEPEVSNISLDLDVGEVKLLPDDDIDPEIVEDFSGLEKITEVFYYKVLYEE